MDKLAADNKTASKRELVELQRIDGTFATWSVEMKSNHAAVAATQTLEQSFTEYQVAGSSELRINVASPRVLNASLAAGAFSILAGDERKRVQ
jgi:hypothetical protein